MQFGRAARQDIDPQVWLKYSVQGAGQIVRSNPAGHHMKSMKTVVRYSSMQVSSANALLVSAGWA